MARSYSICILLISIVLLEECFCKIHLGGRIANKLHRSGIKPVGKASHKLHPSTTTTTDAPEVKAGQRRHMEDCVPLSITEPPRAEGMMRELKETTPDPKFVFYEDLDAETEPNWGTMPTHMDDYHFYVTTALPFYTVGDIKGIGYHPTTRQMDPCEELYNDLMGHDVSWLNAGSSQSESLEMLRVPANPYALNRFSVKKSPHLEYDEAYGDGMENSRKRIHLSQADVNRFKRHVEKEHFKGGLLDKLLPKGLRKTLRK